MMRFNERWSIDDSLEFNFGASQIDQEAEEDAGGLEFVEELVLIGGLILYGPHRQRPQPLKTLFPKPKKP